MTSSRPYRPPMTFERALRELQRSSGTQFWPDAVEALAAIPRSELRELLMTDEGADA